MALPSRVEFTCAVSLLTKFQCDERKSRSRSYSCRLIDKRVRASAYNFACLGTPDDLFDKMDVDKQVMSEQQVRFFSSHNGNIRTLIHTYTYTLMCRIRLDETFCYCSPLMLASSEAVPSSYPFLATAVTPSGVHWVHESARQRRDDWSVGGSLIAHTYDIPCRGPATTYILGIFCIDLSKHPGKGRYITCSRLI